MLYFTTKIARNKTRWSRYATKKTLGSRLKTSSTLNRLKLNADNT